MYQALAFTSGAAHGSDTAIFAARSKATAIDPRYRTA
jgi:hypothetical protein